VKFARARNILCQGRGSAANSAVCYCLEVTSVDPAKIDVLFERFISAARGEPPDIDIDFEHERREEVIQYVYDKYGRERAGMTATVITYRGRSAVRDVGKALGLGLDVVDQLAKRLDWWHRGTLTNEQLRESGVDPSDPTVRGMIELTSQLLGFPRHLSQHTGGMVMTRVPLCEMVPIENASMKDRTVIEWDKDDIDAVGILKVDVLALGMLTVLSKALALINRRHEGTKARRHEGKEGDSHGGNSDASGFDCVAEGHGAVESDLPRDAANARIGTVWPDQPDETGGGLRPVQHCGGVCAGESTGVPEAPAHFARLSGGTFDAVGAGCGLGTHPPERGGRCASGRNGSRPPRTDPRRPELKNAPNALTASSPTPSCLRAFVPSCLSPESTAHPAPLELHTLPHEDPATYDMMCDADTIGVFQIESRAQMSMLPRLRPRQFYDIVIEVAIVRPGPIQGNMVHPYLRRRAGEEEVTYPSQDLYETLKNTLGVPLFQEQAMRVVMVAAGFSAEEADQLRRAMAAWRKNGVIDRFYPKIVSGMLARGYTREFAEQTFQQIQGFGEYGFPESHAASFALLVYASAWIKRHHPAVFACALLNSQPMGFYAPAQIVRDARDHGVEVRPVDVNESEWDCTLEERHEGTEARRHEGKGKERWGLDGPALRLGFRQISGLREDHVERLVASRRRHGRFTSIEEFHQVTELPVVTVKRLTEADAFGSVGDSRRPAIWNTLPLRDADAPLFDPLRASVPSCLRASIPEMPIGQEVMTDYATLRLSLKKHPVAIVRPALDERKILTANQINQTPNGKWVKVAGLVLIRQRPGTASGIVFETLEDETGIVNLIVRPDVYERYRPAARHAALLQCDGYLERQGQVVHIMAKRLFDLSHLLAGYRLESRDFH
jgi:error-prone DNA polymerase